MADGHKCSCLPSGNHKVCPFQVLNVNIFKKVHTCWSKSTRKALGFSGLFLEFLISQAQLLSSIRQSLSLSPRERPLNANASYLKLTFLVIWKWCLLPMSGFMLAMYAENSYAIQIFLTKLCLCQLCYFQVKLPYSSAPNLGSQIYIQCKLHTLIPARSSAALWVMQCNAMVGF